ncbi:MAG: SDR family NAD(P)-dependent oxidoreductase [Cephaloticoccus sp.]
MASLSEGLRSFSAVIVTGGSSGIGKSFIGLIHSVNPGLHFCNLSRSEPAIKSAGLKLRHLAIDLARPADLPVAAAAVSAWLREEAPAGRVLLINNSGFGGYGRFPQPEVAHNLEMIDLNVRALVDLTGRLLPALQERGGAIINVASTAAFQPTPWMAVYGATKAFVLHWSLALREELRPRGIEVLAVCPGPTGTQFFRRAGLRQGSVNPALSLTSDEVARQSLHALVNGRGLVVTGWKNKVGAALVSKLPKVFAAWLAAKVLARFRLKQVAP